MSTLSTFLAYCFVVLIAFLIVIADILFIIATMVFIGILLEVDGCFPHQKKYFLLITLLILEKVLELFKKAM